MRPCIHITTLLLWTTFSFGQLVQRQDNETVEQFATRLKPDSANLTYIVIETKWDDSPVVIAFYDQPYKLSKQNDPDQQTYHRIIGNVFIQMRNNYYGKSAFGTIDTDGGDPAIETAFFANADMDTTAELIVIASWDQRHYEVSGTLYGTFVFDYELTSARLEWDFLEEISNKLDGGCECSWSDGTNKEAKFKTEADIKAELQRLGYIQ